MAGIDRALLYIAKDAIGKELSKPQQPCSTPAKLASSEALLLLIINQQ